MTYIKQNFLECTKRVSQSDTPLLHEVIPYIDKLTTLLENTIADKSVLAVVRVAAARGLSVMNKYYSCTDESIMYRCAMRMLHLHSWLQSFTLTIFLVVLHPRYKSRYFRQQQWEEEWIRVAEALLRDLYDKHYKPKEVVPSTMPASAPAKVSSLNLDLQ